MLERFKKKSPRTSQGLILSEDYAPASLPKYGASLDTFITGDYSLLSTDYIQGRYQACEDALKPLVQTSDRFSQGKMCDAYVDGQIAHLEARFQEETALHALQGEQIKSALAVRKGLVDRRLAKLEESRAALRKEWEPLKDTRAQFEFRLGRTRVPLGLPVTVAAMIVDGLLNYSYLQGILLQSAFLLLICVVCLSVMSDGSMYVLGNLLSRRKERFMTRPLFWLTVGGLAGMFLLSIAAGVMIRFGSMDVTYGSINAAGEFVGKDHYSMAEWGVSLVTAFLTTATGLISLAFSVDENAHLASRRRDLEAQLAAEDAEYEALSAEREAISQAPDPMERDQVCREAARANLDALRVGLKQHMRMLLAVHQQDATYSDLMGDSAQALLPQEEPDGGGEPAETPEDETGEAGPSEEAEDKTGETAQALEGAAMFPVDAELEEAV